MDAERELAGYDADGQPIYIGSRVVWGVKSGLRFGSVIRFPDKLRLTHYTRPAAEQYWCFTTTTTEGKYKGHGGVQRCKGVFVIQDKPEPSSCHA